MIERGRDAQNLKRSLALRMEAEYPVGAAALLDSLARMDGDVLLLRYPAGKRYSYRVMKGLEDKLSRYCDHPIRAELIE